MSDKNKPLVEVVPIESLQPDPNNANRGTERGSYMLNDSLTQSGAGRSILATGDGVILAGNKTHEQAVQAGFTEVIKVHTTGEQLVAVVRDDLEHGSREATRIALEDNRIGQESLDFDPAVLLEMGKRDETLTEGLWRDDEWEELLGELFEPADDEPPPLAQMDKGEELAQKYGTATGQIWELGEHRLAVGDCTSAETVARLMGDELAVLCHSDPPYGMGKEKDGIANDNLYRDKLDAFQMAWWRACRPSLEDNASAYIWGNAEDLWRLWYCGGLRDSERLTLRNEVVWDKQSEGNPTLRVCGATFKNDRSLTQSERALFFMLGEQGFNTNADNYWEGWEPIRSYLAAQVEIMGWGPKDIKRITGVGMFGHWFTKSQFVFITREHYVKLQTAARDYDAFKRDYDAFKRDYDAFKRDYDELKRDFYATRAYFDNTHDNMTDVWQFQRVQGDERHGHATPKPVEMMARIIKSSSRPGDNVLVPFCGTWPEMIACEQLNRRCFGVEISPAYAAVSIQRWLDLTGLTPVKVQDASTLDQGADAR